MSATLVNRLRVGLRRIVASVLTLLSSLRGGPRKRILSTVVAHRHWLRLSASCMYIYSFRQASPVGASLFLECHRNPSRRPGLPPWPSPSPISYPMPRARKKVGGPHHSRVSLKPGTCPPLAKPNRAQPLMYLYRASLPARHQERVGGSMHERVASVTPPLPRS